MSFRGSRKPGTGLIATPQTLMWIAKKLLEGEASEKIVTMLTLRSLFRSAAKALIFERSPLTPRWRSRSPPLADNRCPCPPSTPPSQPPPLQCSWRPPPPPPRARGCNFVTSRIAMKGVASLRITWPLYVWGSCWPFWCVTAPGCSSIFMS